MKKLVMAATLLMLVGCATTTSKKVEEDIAQQNDINTRQSMNTGLNAIVSSKNLSDAQKAELIGLMDSTRLQMHAIRRGEAQAKSAFFKYLASGELEDRRINAYRKELVSLENQKMDIMFSNLKKTRKILGDKLASDKSSPELREIYQVHADLE